VDGEREEVKDVQSPYWRENCSSYLQSWRTREREKMKRAKVIVCEEETGDRKRDMDESDNERRSNVRRQVRRIVVTTSVRK
jgi:hypothetical protein